VRYRVTSFLNGRTFRRRLTSLASADFLSRPFFARGCLAQLPLMMAMHDWLVGCLRIKWFIYRIQMAMDLPSLDAPSDRWIFVGGKGGVGNFVFDYCLADAFPRSRSSCFDGSREQHR
jgi:hypothetical protein